MTDGENILIAHKLAVILHPPNLGYKTAAQLIEKLI